MAPNAEVTSNASVPPSTSNYEKPIVKTYKWEIAWRNVLAFVYLHIAGLYGLYLFLFKCNWGTFFTAIFLLVASIEGITAGAHRLWTHRTYKANLPLRILLMIFQTMAFQNHIYEWSRDHRVHHKFTDTDADPHNAKRGFFFSHMGWLMVKKHKDVMIKGKTVDLSDLEADPVVTFQKKYYLIMLPILCFMVPTAIPIYLFGEDPWTAFYVSGILRYVISLHGTWFVNSAAHLWGPRPYDKAIGPAENGFVITIALGEGYHNYHHVFPWDYKAAELGNYTYNLSAGLIDFFAKIGWAWDLKTVSPEMVDKRVLRTGDGSRKVNKQYILNTNEEDHHHGDVWGWGDADMKEEDIREARIFNALKDD